MGAIRAGKSQEVIAEAREAIQSAGSRRFILAPGCGIAMDTPVANLQALRGSVESYH